MAAKPSATPRWANVGGVIVEPSSGKKDVGWLSDERPPAQYFNWWKNLAYQWFEYLKDGALSGAHTIDSTLGVTGLITATAGLVAAVNQHVAVSGTGRFKHGPRTMMVPFAAFQPQSPASVWTTDYTSFTGVMASSSATDMTVFAPVMLPAGKRITQLVWTLGHGAGASTRTYQLRSKVMVAGTLATPFTETDARSSEDPFQLTDTGAVTLVAGTEYFLRATLTEDNDSIYGCEITYDDL